MSSKNKTGLRIGFALVGVAAVGLVAAGVVMTKTLHLQPCPLCVFQRVLYLSVALFAFIAALSPRTLFLGGALSLLSALGGLATAAYQSYMQAFPAAFGECNMGVPTNPIERLVDYLGNISPTLFFAWGDCTSREWVFLKLSIANWSAIVFAFFAVVIVLLMRARKSGRRR